MRILLRLPPTIRISPRVIVIGLALLVLLRILLRWGCGAGEQAGEDESSAPPPPASQLERIRESGVLRVATRNAPTILFYDRHEEAAGPEVELILEFADYLGVRPEFEIRDTVADSNIVAANRRCHPESSIAYDLDDPDSLVWVLPRDAEDLQQAVETWLAAQSYQESHWHPRAESPTGVRGIMILTQPTAKSVGVTDRLDARQNIEGGAKYLARLEGRLDPAIEEPDRLYLALAAYDVGMGHLRDAQTPTRRQGKDPHRWVDVKETLPLLKQRKYPTTVQYGYARGYEPVRYVEQVRNYGDIVERKRDVRH